MPRELPAVDVVVTGMGWTGSIVAKELAANGQRVVGLERGEMRNTPQDFYGVQDELRFAQRYDMMQDLSRETVTFRNNLDQTALPMRRHGSFLLGTGVGGAGAHWNGATWRFLPYDFQIRSQTIERYGAGRIPADMPLQDWGITYDELEPYFNQFEVMAGICGRAGNLKGEIRQGGNPFEGQRSAEYPNPPMVTTPILARFRDAASALGYTPFPRPSANMSQEYTNPDGQTLSPCHYCGFCERFGCDWNAKSSPLLTAVPAAQETGNFELRTNANVVGLEYDGQRVTGVHYVDVFTGEALFQPATVVALTSYVMNNVRFLLMARIGAPYDPSTGRGVVGRNYCYQNSNAEVTGFFDDEKFNMFMGSGALGYAIDDLNGDNFDHAELDFLHGGSIAIGQSGRRPIAGNPVPPGTPSWGREFKRASLKYYNRSFGFSCQGAVLPYRGNYLDLDPTYTDKYGNPLLRMTFDWTDQDRRLVAYEGEKVEEIMREIGPGKIAAQKTLEGSYDIVPYQSTHNTGGAVMGGSPDESVVNSFLQHWDADNLFVVGASAFAHNGGYNPTGTVGALSFRAADGMKRYFESPGPLV